MRARLRGGRPQREPATAAPSSGALGEGRRHAEERPPRGFDHDLSSVLRGRRFDPRTVNCCTDFGSDSGQNFVEATRYCAPELVDPPSWKGRGYAVPDRLTNEGDYKLEDFAKAMLRAPSSGITVDQRNLAQYLKDLNGANPVGYAYFMTHWGCIGLANLALFDQSTIVNRGNKVLEKKKTSRLLSSRPIKKH